MARLKFEIVAFLSFLTVMLPSAVKAENTASDPGKTSNRPAAHNRHRRHKKTPADPASSNPPIAPVARTATPAGASNIPGIADPVGSNSAAGAHMGASDHTPGTTGTSGQ